MVKCKESYELILLEEKHFKELYNWNISEKHFEQYTCRPVNLSKSYEEYAGKMKDAINNIKGRTYILVSKENYNQPLGKISLFDYNPRNHSGEFGYYLPEHNRGKGFGKAMLEKFVNVAFEDKGFNLNKLYATTASNNLVSIKLLEGFGFILDGRMREHYWINGEIYDQCVYSILKCEKAFNFKLKGAEV